MSGARTQGAILGSSSREVNEDGLLMDSGGKSCDFRLSQAFTYTVVKKGFPAAAASG